jgi:arginyl-tRNA synthetase
MLNLINSAVTEIHRVLLEATGRCIADELLPSEPIPAFAVEIPADRSHGDFASNIAMISAKAFHLPPRKIA